MSPSMDGNVFGSKDADMFANKDGAGPSTYEQEKQIQPRIMWRANKFAILIFGFR